MVLHANAGFIHTGAVDANLRSFAINCLGFAIENADTFGPREDDDVFRPIGGSATTVMAAYQRLAAGIAFKLAEFININRTDRVVGAIPVVCWSVRWPEKVAPEVWYGAAELRMRWRIEPPV